MEVIKRDTSNLLVQSWKDDFIGNVKLRTQSRKVNFNYLDAVNRATGLMTPLDKVMVDFLEFINSDPLRNNDYFKYIDAYVNGKKLNLKYFRHNIEKLKGYYAKIDANKGRYNPFNLKAYHSYVLFMMLKLEGVYSPEYDGYFHVQYKDGREYTPMSKIPSVLRGELPFMVKEFDIHRAYPTFIDIELGIDDRKEDVYSLMEKVEFNTLLNIHKDVEGASLKRVRERLKPIYNGRTNEVVTEERFNDRGRMFRELVKYEENAILNFVEVNEIKNYVRLHDGVFVKADVEAHTLNFGKVRFAIKESIKPPIINETINFYFIDSKGKVQTSPKQYADFFIQENIVRGIEEGNDTLIIFKDTNNVVKPFNHKTESVKYLKDNINELYSDEVENRIARDLNYAIHGGYLLLPSKAIEYYIDSKDSFGIPFKDKFFKYSHDTKNIECLPYKEVKGFFAPHKTQTMDFEPFKYTQDSLSEFQVFLTMASTGKDPRNEKLTAKDKETFYNFCLMFGYLCHTYKDQARSPAIILSDEGANDLSRNGGRGKTLLTKALSFVQPTILKGGNEFKPDYNHNFADLDNSRRIYILDDVQAGFNYDALYTNIIGDISCQLKGAKAKSIPFAQAPKFIITTNWAVRYNEEDTSTCRRFLEYKFTTYFNIENTPNRVFGHNLFQDWSANEWNLFYNFVFYCVEIFLENGLVKIQYDKSDDNFRANFNNDAVLDEFNRLFSNVSTDIDGFTVSSFLRAYNHFDNPLRHEKFFNKNNVKFLIDTYIKHHNLNFKYVTRSRKWERV